MEVIKLTQKQLDKLKEYKLPDDLFTAEASLYIFPIENKWQTVNKLLKKFHITNISFIDNKIKTIKSLIESKNIINIPELVLPEKIVIVDNKVVGYTMELVNSVTLEYALLSDEISTERKIKYFIQIGKILEKMEYLRIYTSLKDFYLNDIHESNFVIDTNTDTIRVVDIDSCKINENYSLTIGSKYLQPDTIITYIPKYKQDENFVYGCNFIPSRETDLYCYIIMILNFMYGDEIEKLTPEELYDYLDYLHSLGVSTKLINIFKKILSNSPNENPYNFLEELIPFYGRSHKNVYKCNRKK